MPSNAGGRFGGHACLSGAQGGDAAEPDVASSAAPKLLKVCTASADWAQRSGVEVQRARRCVVRVVVGELKEVVLGCLNDQTVSTARCHAQLREEPHSREAVNATRA
jgi:hypothetical protein